MAAKKPKHDQVSVRRMRDRLLVTIGFIEDAQDFPGGVELRKIVETLADKSDARALLLVAKEVDAMTLSLASHEREGLEAILKAQFGVDAETARAEQRRRAEAAVRRGNVASEVERRHLEEYLEMLSATGADPSEGADVRRLLGSS